MVTDPMDDLISHGKHIHRRFGLYIRSIMVGDIFSFYDIKFTICPYICRPSRPMDGQGGDGDGRSFKNIEDIVCFKCGEKGHFANRCTKGHLAFISLQQNQKQAGENIGK